jgi:hypothetical protein
VSIVFVTPSGEADRLNQDLRTLADFISSPLPLRTAQLNPYLRAFGLTWEDCEQLLAQLGYSAQASIVAR